MPQIEVLFEIDANGVLHVEAPDLGTEKKTRQTVDREGVRAPRLSTERSGSLKLLPTPPPPTGQPPPR